MTRTTAKRRKKPVASAEHYWEHIEQSRKPEVASVIRSTTRSRLLATALEVFAQNGFEATTMRDLAGAVGIKAPAIYNHFPSKDAMLCEALLWAMEHFRTEVLADYAAVADPVKRLHGVLDRHINYQLTHPIIARAFDNLASSNGALLIRIGKPESQRQLREQLVQYQRAVTITVSEIMGASPASAVGAQTMAIAITTLYDSVIRWYVSRSQSKDDKLKEDYWTLTRRMLAIPD